MNARTKNRTSRRRRGFTLLEILLVVGLLALLASFAIPALMAQGEEAKKKMVKAAIGSSGPLMQAIDLYKFSTNQFPENLKDLCEKPSNDAIAKKWTGPYLKDLSGLRDPWDHDYYYNRAGQKNEGSVDLWSAGPDGQDGTDDDIVNWKTDK